MRARLFFDVYLKNDFFVPCARLRALRYDRYTEVAEWKILRPKVTTVANDFKTTLLTTFKFFLPANVHSACKNLFSYKFYRTSHNLVKVVALNPILVKLSENECRLTHLSFKHVWSVQNNMYVSQTANIFKYFFLST